MKKIIYSWLIILVALSTTAYAQDSQSELLSCKASHERINPDIEDDGMLWYRTSASKKAIFNQINSQVLTAVSKYKNSESQLSSSKGVVISLDSTVFDSSDYDYYKDLGCIDKDMTFGQFIRKYELSANIGMGDLLCSLQSQGLKIFLVTNRSVTNEFSDDETKKDTIKNLEDKNICFDAILFANSDTDTNKNPRFNAISSGDYENINTTKKFGPINVVAYLGSDIQDFPNFKQDSAKLLNTDSPQFNNFGTSYFIYPNPILGSWSSNYWK
ncbi:MAG: hypothetical protein EKK64_02125 [Neisseriaceae bacterium]|nr:MAG: hypothetical protein EKK64_02125 [Neisseriaceae bacterium]